MPMYTNGPGVLRSSVRSEAYGTSQWARLPTPEWRFIVQNHPAFGSQVSCLYLFGVHFLISIVASLSFSPSLLAPLRDIKFPAVCTSQPFGCSTKPAAASLRTGQSHLWSLSGAFMQADLSFLRYDQFKPSVLLSSPPNGFVDEHDAHRPASMN